MRTDTAIIPITNTMLVFVFFMPIILAQGYDLAIITFNEGGTRSKFFETKCFQSG